MDPWKRNEYDVIGYYIQRREWARAQQKITKTLDMWAEAKRIRGYEADYTKKQDLSKQILVTGDGLFVENKPTEAAVWYVQAQKVDTWAFNTYPPIFIRHAVPAQVNLVFFSGLKAIQGTFFGRYREEYASVWQSALVDSLRTGNAVDVFSHAEGIMNIAPWAYSRLWKEVAPLLIQKAEDKDNAGQPEQAAEQLLQVFVLWKSLIKNGQQADWGLQQKTARLLVGISNVIAPHNLVTTATTYDAALSMVPWIGDQVAPWYKQYASKEIDTPALITYINSDINSGQWDSMSKAYAVLFLVEKMIDEDKPQVALGYANIIDTTHIIDYPERKKKIITLQKRADDLMSDNRQQDAEALVTIMAKMLPENYWVQAQQGYFYVAIGDKEKAKKSFSECLVLRLGNHDECSSGLQKINKGDLRGGRYQQISLIIQEKARWQDFVQ